MRFDLPTTLALVVKSLFFSLCISSVQGVPTNEQCASQIDNKISNFSPEDRRRGVTINSIEPCPTCIIYGLLDIERDNNYPVEIEEVDGGIKYSVVVMLKNFTRRCHCRVRATVDGVVDLIYNTIFDNPALEHCDPNSIATIVKNNADINLPGLIPAPNKTVALLTCAPSVQEALQIIASILVNLINSNQVDLYLNGQSEGVRNKFTIFVDSNGYGKVTDYRFGLNIPTNFKNWCEGSPDNVGLKNLCTCLLQTNAGVATFTKIVLFFLPCYVNTNVGYRQIVDALTCT